MSLKPKDVPGLSCFNWDDPFFLEQQLNEEERMMRDAARTFAQEKLQPRVIEAYANETTETKIFVKWEKWVCLALPFLRNTAV